MPFWANTVNGCNVLSDLEMMCKFQVGDNDWDWRSICQDFLFDTQVPHLENLLETHYAGDVKSFIQQYLEPVLALLKDIKTSAEVSVTIKLDVLLMGPLQCCCGVFQYCLTVSLM